MAGAIEVVKQKLDGRQGRWSVDLVAEDDHGAWLFHPEWTTYAGVWPDGRTETCFAGRPEAPGCAVLLLVPHDAWWLAMWRLDPHQAISVDLCRPTERAGATWTYVDLELDLWSGPVADVQGRRTDRRNGRTVLFADQDELEDAVRAGLVDPAAEAVVWAAAEDVAARILDGVAPFDQAAWERLRLAAGR